MEVRTDDIVAFYQATVSFVNLSAPLATFEQRAEMLTMLANIHEQNTKLHAPPLPVLEPCIRRLLGEWRADTRLIASSTELNIIKPIMYDMTENAAKLDRLSLSGLLRSFAGLNCKTPSPDIEASIRRLLAMEPDLPLDSPELMDAIEPSSSTF